MLQGSRFHLEDVVRHLVGRDASLRWMKTSHGLPVKASADRRLENLAITIAQCQLSTDVRRQAISRYGPCYRHRKIWDENVSARSKLRRNRATFEHILKSIEQELAAQSSSTSVEAIRNSIRTWCGLFVVAISSNSCRSLCH